MVSLVLPRDTSTLEAVHIFGAVAVGTLIVNSVIHMILLRLRRRPRVAFQAHGYVVSEVQDLKIKSAIDPYQPSRLSSVSIGDGRGLLSGLKARSQSHEKLDISQHQTLQQTCMALRAAKERFPQTTYNGQSQHHSGIEMSCLFARRRYDGITHTLAKVAWLFEWHDTQYIRIRLHPTDANRAIDAGHAIGLPQNITSKLMSKLSMQTAREVLLFLPRTQDDCEALAQLLDAAVVFATGSQPEV